MTGRPDVDVWFQDLDSSPVDGGNLDTLQLRRANRFKFERDRARYVARHSFLRIALATYVHRRPDEVRFGYGPQGKPVLLDHQELFFSSSSSDQGCLLAVARFPVGVDLERIDRPPAPQSLTRRLLGADELSELEGMSAAQRHERFLELWTAREACSKASGAGLHGGLPRPTADWSIHPLSTRPGYVASLACTVASLRLSYRTDEPV